MGSTSLETPIEVLKLIEVPQQKIFNGVAFPLVISPAVSSVNNLTEVVGTHKTWVEAKLHEAGAVLFRGFNVPTASDFNDVVKCFGYEAFPFGGVAAPRTPVIGNINTSNDSPPHYHLQFHNEIAYMQMKDSPSKGFFYCEVEPGSQGETPIVLGHIIYERLKRKHPDFIRRLEEHGIIYQKVLPSDTDVSSPIGRSWKTTFSTHDKTVVENQVAKNGWKIEWQENGMKVSIGPISGIKTNKTRSEEQNIWFNSIMVVHISPVLAGNELENPVTLGDGSPLPPEVVDAVRVISEEECVAIPWKQGDVLLLDNQTVQHARRPFTPPRRILVSFTK